MTCKDGMESPFKSTTVSLNPSEAVVQFADSPLEEISTSIIVTPQKPFEDFYVTIVM